MMKNNAWFPWNGSKVWLLDKISPLLSLYDGKGAYYEPFLGCGVVSEVVKSLHPNVTHNLNDINPWLISAFENQISEFNNLPNNIYDVDIWRAYKDSDIPKLGTFLSSVRFAICLYSAWGNRWKSRLDGSMGNENPVNQKFCEKTYLDTKLKSFFSRKWVTYGDIVTNKDWKLVVYQAKSGDLVYLDPPYPESLGYGNSTWTFSDQLDVVDFAAEAHKKGVKLIISNMSTIERLYSRVGLETFVVAGGAKTKTRKLREEVIAHNLV
jgi:site-specific DNA-adenine methylase